MQNPTVQPVKSCARALSGPSGSRGIPRFCSLLLLLPVCSFAAPVPPGPGAAIQAAIDALPAGGGRVELASGTYVLTRPIVIARDNVELVGQGTSTVLYLADKSNCPGIIAGETNAVPRKVRRFIRIADLFIDGNKDGQKWECWGGACDQEDGSVVRNNGINLRGVQDTRVERVTVARARSSGLCAEKGCRRLTVSDFTGYDAFFDGLSGYVTEDSLFTRLHLYKNKSAGLSFDLQFNHNVLTDVILTENGSQGLFMRESLNNLFQGFVVRESGEQGVFIAQVEYRPETHASGNTFTGVMISGCRGVAFRVNDATCVNNTLSNAQLFGNKEGGLSEVVPGIVRTFGVVER